MDAAHTNTKARLEGQVDAKPSSCQPIPGILTQKIRVRYALGELPGTVFC